MLFPKLKSATQFYLLFSIVILLILATGIYVAYLR